MAGFQVGKRVAAAALLGMVALGLSNQAAQARETIAEQAVKYPVRPITVIVTFPPGGGTDLLARKLGPRLEKALGQPVIIDNRPGASGNIGARAVAYARADGYTLLMANSSFAINPGVFRNLGFKPKEDFAPIANIGFVPSVIVTGHSSDIQNLEQVLEQQSEPALAYASCGNGTPQHLAGEMLYDLRGTALLHIPYRGCGPALNDVVAGQVPIGIVTLSSAATLIESGHLRALAVTSAQRSPVLPDVPTVAEISETGFELDQWHGLLAPSHTPEHIINTLNSVVQKAVMDPAMQSQLLALGYTSQEGNESAQASGFKAMIWNDIDRFGALAYKIGLQVD
ncbi:ABC transporter substrate-binding protein [Alcaligenes faecalis]|uniref:tripartite tricarboxylate transporter substrate binding protein n=2 Tax=Alcaligenes faecalis TaxID=511 RepID=UPI0007C5CB54|nr:tripartite tricarboxylate transporter substrate binding protein [Alcaligenes faecalis]ARP53145.1 ABC transporter substrate-binding protein [Alcaligenes faecalis]